jgi:O-antigen/teichoic acid export membrane protein
MNYFLSLLHLVRSKQLTRTFSVYTIGKGVSLLLSIFLLPLFTKKLPTVEFGVIGLLWLVIPLLSRVMNLGMDVGMSLKFFKEDHQALSQTLYNGLFAIIFVAVLIWLLGCTQIYWIQLVIDKTVTRKIFTLLIISCLFASYTTLMCSFLQNAGKATFNVIMTILPQLIIVGLTYYFVLYVEASYTSYIWGMALGNLITGLFALGFFFKNYPLRYFRFSLPILKNLLRIGLPVLPGTIGGIILASGDRYMIKYFLGLEAVAIYTFGYRFASQVAEGLFQPFQKALSPVIYKKAARSNTEGRAYNIKIINNILLIFSIIIAAAIIPMRDIMDIMGTHAYAAAYPVFIVSLIGIFIYTVSQAESYSLIFIERTELTAATVIVGAGINICLNYVFIPKYGIIAAAFTTIISYLIMLVSRNYLLLYFFKQKNLLQLILRVIPLAGYAGMIYLVEIFIDNILIGYAVKITTFALFVLLIWFFFAEFRNMFKSFLLNRPHEI